MDTTLLNLLPSGDTPKDGNATEIARRGHAVAAWDAFEDVRR